MSSTTPITTVDFFYDGQIRRFLLQIIRAFSGFQYQSGYNSDGTVQTQIIPCRMATQNAQAASIINNNSENTLNACPMITVFIKGMEISRERTQAPGLVSKVQVTERQWDPMTSSYTNCVGNRYTVERVMPHPLVMVVQVDVWTSNEMQKHQIFEQIYSMFNVGFNIQNSNNAVDWSALSTMELTNITWSDRAIPVGNNTSQIDVMSLEFTLPMWISPPAKVLQQKLIEQIVTNVHNTTTDEYHYPNTASFLQDAVGWEVGTNDPSPVAVTSIVTPGENQIEISNGVVTLLGPNGDDVDPNGNPYNWRNLLVLYGHMNPTKSVLRLIHSLEDGYSNLDVIGYIQYGSQPNQLIWNVDPHTLPGNTLSPVNAIIDPTVSYPGASLSGGTTFPVAVNGQSYLITKDIIGNSVIGSNWGGTSFLASAGDIITYQNNQWVVTFDASSCTTIQFVLNLTSNKQLKFDTSAKQWVMSIDGTYYAGYWRLQL
jgi:hypothetical protein